MQAPTTIRAAAALLCGLAASTAHAQSNVTVYGQLDATIASRQLSGGVRATKVDDGGMSTSNFGFRGTEELGGNLQAVFDLSGFFTVDTGASGRFTGSGDALFSRRATVGLVGKFGRIDVGRVGSPYFFSLIFFNPLVDSAVYSPIFLHTYTNGQFPISAPPIGAPDSGVSNSIAYTSPTINGMNARLQYAPGEVAGDAGKSRISGSLNYNGGPVAMTFAFARDTTALGTLGTLPVPETRQLALLGGITYDFGLLKLFGQLEKTTQTFALASAERRYTTYQLGASVPVGAGKILASWAHSSIDLPAAGVSPYTLIPGFPGIPVGVATSSVDPRRDTTTVGYDYSLSRRTDLYALFMLDKYTGLTTGKSTAFGIRHRF